MSFLHLWVFQFSKLTGFRYKKDIKSSDKDSSTSKGEKSDQNLLKRFRFQYKKIVNSTMGNDEGGAAAKPEKASSPVQEQTNIHPYPNWAAVQAYYGPGIPPPYFNPAVAPGHPPHSYMWSTPQHLMSPYGTPYAAIYPPGGVYPHPHFMASHSQGPGNSSSPAASEAMEVTPISTATPAKSSSNKDQCFIKKLKGLNGDAVPSGKVNSGSSAASHSEGYGTEGSSDGSDENTAGRGDQIQRKRKCEGVTSTGKDGYALAVYGQETNVTSSMTPGVTIVRSSVAGKPMGTVPFSGKPSTAANSVLVAEVPSQNGLASGHMTRDERELKRERRKQSNRESARRSRLRRQTETEELALKAEALNAENSALRSEINQLTENSEKLRLENASLMNKLKSAELEKAKADSTRIESQEGQPVSTENFLSRVESSLSSSNGTERETETNEQSNSGKKLRQLLEKSSRTDALTAS